MKLLFVLVIFFSSTTILWGRCDMIASVSRYFITNCVYLVNLSERFPEVNNILKLTKRLSSQDIPIQTLNIQILRKHFQQLHRSCSKPLFAVNSDGQDINQNLLQLMTSIAPSSSSWLLILSNNVSLDEIFQNVFIPFDCEFVVAQPSGNHKNQSAEFGVGGGATVEISQRVKLTEIYRITRLHPLIKVKFGWWDERGGFRAPQQGLYARRHNLHGLTLRTSIFHDPPISEVKNSSGKIKFGGFVTEVWKALKERLNFTILYEVPKTGSWGSESNGCWDGTVGMIMRDQADLGIVVSLMTPERAAVVDFTIPLINSYLNVYIRAPSGREVSWGNILSPFTPSLWLAVIITTLAVATLLSLFQRYGDSRDHISLYDALFVVFGALFCLQGHPTTPRSNSARIVYILPYIIGVIVLSSYSAVLTSVLTVSRPRLPFTTLRGLRDDGSYAFGVARGSPAHKIIENQTEGFLRDLYEKNNLKKNAPSSYAAGFRWVCRSRYAFIAASQIAELTRKTLKCSIVELPEHFTHGSASYAVLPKNSPYKGILNHFLLKLKEDGVLSHVLEKGYGRKLEIPREDSIGINLEAAAPVLLIGMLGILLACTVLGLEKLISNFSIKHRC